MITCVVDYIIDPRKIDAFERFAKRWIDLVNRHGGLHHGYFLPSEGASDRALALFGFPNLAEYERYRSRFGVDQEFIDVIAFETRVAASADTIEASCAPCLRTSREKIAVFPPNRREQAELPICPGRTGATPNRWPS